MKIVESFKDSFPIEAPPKPVVDPYRKDATLKILRTGLAKISRPSGWIKGRERLRVNNPNGDGGMYAYCMIGSLKAAGGVGFVDYQDAEWHLRRAIPAHFTIPSFNDHPSTTLEDVQRAFEWAIESREQAIIVREQQAAEHAAWARRRHEARLALSNTPSLTG